MKVLAFDFGGSSGRALLGELKNGKLKYREIHRFANNILRSDDLYWDFDNLWANVKKAISMAPDIDSIGIDTWGVDYGVIDAKGNLKHNPYHYRSDRTNACYDEIMSDMGDTLYSDTGIEVMKINTMFQLVAEMKDRGFDKGDKILFMPDLFAYMLTGNMRSEYTIATTSALIDKESRTWNESLIKRLRLPMSIFSPIIKNGDTYGYVKEDLARELGLEKPVKVIAVCSHDTASAITAMVSNPKESIYISCGTWSLIGVERDKVDTSSDKFTNEGGFDGSVTYLSNIMGLWLMQELRRNVSKEVGHDVTFPDLEAMMGDSEVGKYIVDTNDASFVAPDNMEQAIKDYIKRKYGADISRGEVVRCIYDSLANAYNDAVQHINSISNNRYKVINVLGGGSKSVPLLKETNRLTHLKVAAGPCEATAIGNILVQLLSLGEIENIDKAREIVARSEKVKIYE